MPFTNYRAGEIPSKASTMTPDELQSLYDKRRRHIEQPSFLSCAEEKKAIESVMDPENFVHTQEKLFELLKTDQSIDPEPSELTAINGLLAQAHYRQKIADEYGENSVMDDQVELQDTLLGDATRMAILRSVSRSVSCGGSNLCLTKARNYCTPSLLGETSYLFEENPLC